MMVARSIVAVCVPDRLMHLVQDSMAAHPSTALRFRDRTISKGGIAGEEALCNAWSDCRHAVKQVQEPPLMAEEDDLWRGLIVGVVVGLGK